MIPVESTGANPFARSIVVTVSIPRPANVGGRRTARHWTSGCAAPLPSLYVGSQDESFEEATTFWFFASASGSDAFAYGSGPGSAVDETMRTALPIMRAST